MARSQTTRTTTIGPDHNLSTPEPEPVANDSTPIWDLVIRDMHERDAEGRRKYGTPLQAGNGRDPLVDAYQEALDLVVYLRQAIEERGRIEARDPAPAEHCEISRPDIASRIMELGARGVSVRFEGAHLWLLFDGREVLYRHDLSSGTEVIIALGRALDLIDQVRAPLPGFWIEGSR